jgi:hypothetical protein
LSNSTPPSFDALIGILAELPKGREKDKNREPAWFNQDIPEEKPDRKDGFFCAQPTLLLDERMAG